MAWYVAVHFLFTLFIYANAVHLKGNYDENTMSFEVKWQTCSYKKRQNLWRGKCKWILVNFYDKWTLSVFCDDAKHTIWHICRTDYVIGTNSSIQ